jgi:Zn-dependent protease
MGGPIHKIKPAVEKRVLLYLAALMWICAGTMLMGFAWVWLHDFGLADALPRAGAGIVIALIIHHFGFLRVVDKNLARILPMEGKRCLFSFMAWESYLIVALMALMGVALRHSPIPKGLLAVVYTSIGLALVLSSIRYLRVLRCTMLK